MKKLLAIVLATMMAMALMAGCAPAAGSGVGDGNTPAENLTFTFVLPMVPNEIWVVAKEGFEDACAKLGVTAEVVMPSKPNDINEMNNLMETAIASGTDALITQPVNPEGMAPAFAKLVEAKIPFATVNSDAPDSGRLVSVGTGGDLGRIAGEYIAEQMGDTPIKYITALWALEASLAIAIDKAYDGALSEAAGGAKKLATLETKSELLHITSEWQNAFATYPDANVAINVCGFGAAGAAKSAEEAGISSDDLFIMGIDDIEETLDGIRSGRIQATMSQNFYRMGYQAATTLYENITEGKTPASDVVDSSTMVVNKENIDTYQADMRDPSKWV